jgi:hypothetical protein
MYIFCLQWKACLAEHYNHLLSKSSSNLLNLPKSPISCLCHHLNKYSTLIHLKARNLQSRSNPILALESQTLCPLRKYHCSCFNTCLAYLSIIMFCFGTSKVYDYLLYKFYNARYSCIFQLGLWPIIFFFYCRPIYKFAYCLAYILCNLSSV